MNNKTRRFVAAGVGVALTLLAVPIPFALAAGGRVGLSSLTQGNDVSYPQCGMRLPSGQAFGIVGVNGGLANTLNPCLGPSSSFPSYRQSELYWAQATSSGLQLHQPKAQLYVNTADPGNWYNDHPVLDWPIAGNTPYGSCTTTTVTSGTGTTYTVGENSPACAYQYGEDRVNQDLANVGAAAQAINGQESRAKMPPQRSYRYWLDVETANSWLDDTAINVADLQGMVDTLHTAGVGSVGVYSTPPAWQQITASSTAVSLAGRDNWLPGAVNLSGAQGNCRKASFTGGNVTVTQWTTKYDYDYSCVG